MWLGLGTYVALCVVGLIGQQLAASVAHLIVLHVDHHVPEGEKEDQGQLNEVR